MVDASLFEDTQCFFAGGTAVALRCNEFRWSADIDFLCACTDGYRKLRSHVFYHGAQSLFTHEVTLLREARCDRYGIRLAISIGGAPMKIEIVSEGRITLAGTRDPNVPVLRLSDQDLVAEKLLANTDRFLDDASLGRDALDLIVLEHTLGELPPSAFVKARQPYGTSVDDAWQRALQRMKQRPALLARWLQQLDVTREACDILAARLAQVALPDPTE